MVLRQTRIEVVKLQLALGSRGAPFSDLISMIL